MPLLFMIRAVGLVVRVGRHGADSGDLESENWGGAKDGGEPGGCSWGRREGDIASG